VSEVRGGRRAIGHKRAPAFANATLPLDPRVTFYLTTDGLPDQAGGEKGYGFGHDRLAILLTRVSGLPFAEQRVAFEAALAEYQGGLPQRDDITVLGFRFPPSPESAPLTDLNPTEELV
jgi:serine phosphatase RsbU (regulator of sigma subunit)